MSNAPSREDPWEPLGRGGEIGRCGDMGRWDETGRWGKKGSWSEMGRSGEMSRWDEMGRGGEMGSWGCNPFLLKKFLASHPQPPELKIGTYIVLS